MMRLGILLLWGALQVQTEKAVIEGFVRTMGTNAPVVGAEVTAVGAPPATLTTTKTDSNGHYVLSVNPAGYRVSVRQTGYVSQSFGQRSTSPTATMIRVEAGDKRSDISFRLVPTGTIVGRIYDPDGKPMEGVNVRVHQRGWDFDGRRTLNAGGSGIGPNGLAQTNDLGEFRIYWLPPGEYYISARDTRGLLTPGVNLRENSPQKYATTYFPGLIDPNQASAVTVPAGGEIRGIDFTLTNTETVTVRGRLNAPIGDAMAVTNLRMTPVDPESYAEHGPINFTDATQTFTIPSVMPGRWRLVAALRIPNKYNLTGETIVEVGRDPVSNIVVNVSPGQTIRGKVTFEDSPIAVKANLAEKKFNVSLRGDFGVGFVDTSGEVQEDGSFTVTDVGNVNYHVGMFLLPPDFYVSAARMSGVDLLDRGLKMSTLVAGPLEISISGVGGKIEGRVVDAQGAIVPNSRAVLVPDPSLRHRHELFRLALTDEYGRFTISGIVPGQYKLIAMEELPSYAYYDADYLRPIEGKVKAFRVEKNDLIRVDVSALTTTTPQEMNVTKRHR